MTDLLLRPARQLEAAGVGHLDLAGAPDLVTDTVADRLAQVGAEGVAVARLDAVEPGEDAEEGFLDQIAGVEPGASPARQAAAGPALDRRAEAGEELGDRGRLPPRGAGQEVPDGRHPGPGRLIDARPRVPVPGRWGRSCIANRWLRHGAHPLERRSEEPGAPGLTARSQGKPMKPASLAYRAVVERQRVIGRTEVYTPRCRRAR